MRLAVILLVGLAACVQPAPPLEISHVHGVALYDDAVYLATHHGLARHEARWDYVGDRYDYMGFTQDAESPGVFYSSGHPDDPYAFGGVHLGLRRSIDGGHTWEQRSLKGQVDFHALTSIPGAQGWLAGYWQGSLKVSTDAGATWTDHPAPAIAALTASTQRILALTPQGILQADPSDLAWTRVDWDLPPVVSMAAAPDESILLAATPTTSLRSLDRGSTWLEMAIPGAVLFAIDPADSAHIVASTAAAHVLESHDAGATWTTIRAA